MKRAGARSRKKRATKHNISSYLAKINHQKKLKERAEDEAREKVYEVRQQANGALRLHGLSAIFLFLTVAGWVMSCPDLRATYLIPPQSWHSTPGHMVLLKYGRRSGRNAGNYLQALYRYEVGGKIYQSSRLDFNSEFFVISNSGRVTLEEQYLKYKGRPAVTVYYLPEEPAFSVLEPNTRYDVTGPVIWTYAVIVLTGVIHWHYLHHKRLAEVAEAGLNN